MKNCDPTSKDVQEHILKCHGFLEELEDGDLEPAHSEEYSDMLGDTHAQNASVKVFMRVLKLQSKLLEWTLNVP